MPVPEMMLKDAIIGLRMLLRALQFKRTRNLLVYPHFPSKGSTIYRIARAMGWEVTNKLDRLFDHAIYWEYATVRKEYQALEQLKDTDVVNLYNRDISKDTVDDQMQKAFGYSTRLDPTTFEGIVVRKSLTNAVHDGTAIPCPTEKKEGYIYQRLIDSSVNEEEVMDLRIPIVGKTIPHLYLNYRNKQERFKNVPDRAELVLDISKHLSESEVSNILKFCELAHLEFGELDVLRDSIDGRIYIVDANNTPQGPPKNLPAEDKLKSVESLKSAFVGEFLE